jgi:hypothetical protein
MNILYTGLTVKPRYAHNTGSRTKRPESICVLIRPRSTSLPLPPVPVLHLPRKQKFITFSQHSRRNSSVSLAAP